MPIKKLSSKTFKKTWQVLPYTSLMAGTLASLLVAFPFTVSAEEKAPPPAHDQSDMEANSPDIINSQHIEGHIAFLHAELHVTPDQEPLWKPVADAMRADIKETENAERQVANETHGRESAIQYLQNRIMFADLRAQGEARFLAAFQPLYQSMSTRQKMDADALLVSSSADQ